MPAQETITKEDICNVFQNWHKSRKNVEFGVKWSLRLKSCLGPHCQLILSGPQHFHSSDGSHNNSHFLGWLGEMGADRASSIVPGMRVVDIIVIFLLSVHLFIKCCI